MIRTLIFLSLLILLGTACKKEELGFTNHAGNSTVSAQLNGEDWFATGTSGIAINRRDSFNAGFFVTKNGFTRESLNFTTIPMKLGKHPIFERPDWETVDRERPSYAGYTTYLSDGDVIGEWWDSTTDSLYNYCIVDRVDTIKGIIEGRFQVTLVKNLERDFFDTPDTLRFEKGRFSAEIRY